MSEVIPEDGNSNTTLTTNATIVGNIHVTIRFRPLNDREVASGSNNVWAINDNSVQLAPTYPYRNSSSCQFSFGTIDIETLS